MGSNPISFAAKGTQGDRLVLDMATTAATVGKVSHLISPFVGFINVFQIELKYRQKEALPPGWCQDKEGHPIEDAAKALASGMLLPLGGDVAYKGYGLALMVETLCGILGDANYGKKIPVWGKSEEPANLGQCFMAIDPKCFAPNFEERLGDFLTSLRNLEPVKVFIVIVKIV